MHCFMTPKQVPHHHSTPPSPPNHHHHHQTIAITKPPEDPNTTRPTTKYDNKSRPATTSDTNNIPRYSSAYTTVGLQIATRLFRARQSNTPARCSRTKMSKNPLVTLAPPRPPRSIGTRLNRAVAAPPSASPIRRQSPHAHRLPHLHGLSIKGNPCGLV